MRTIKFKIILSFLLAVLSWGTSNAQTAFTFKGKIGNYPVVMELYGYISGVEGDMYYVSQGKNKKLYLKGETINDLDSQVLVWKIYETVNGKYNGTYYVEWNAFIGGSKNIVGKYTNTKGKIFKVNLKCTSTSSAR